MYNGKLFINKSKNLKPKSLIPLPPDPDSFFEELKCVYYSATFS